MFIKHYICTIKLIIKMRNKQPIVPIVREMDIGDIVEYPLERMRVVKATVSMLGVELGRKYRTYIDKVNRIIRVVREV